LGRLFDVTGEDADVLAMVKPQFEVGRERLPAGGVVRDPGLRAESILDVAGAAERLGWGVRDVTASPLPGPAGNVEYFVWFRADAGVLSVDTARHAVETGPP
jgi:23S rRNA (cytidine1920-2'-O)/16S rRNA (cytidine1409-2'-O)-methyltransferase